MKNNLLFEIIKKEIRDVIRDKKTLLMMIIVPIFLYPIMFGFLMSFENSIMTADESVYSKIGFAFEVDEALENIIKELKIEKTEGTQNELKEKFDEGEIDAYITRKDNTFYVFYSEEGQYGQVTLQVAYNLIDAYEKVAQSTILINNKINPEKFYNIYTVKAKEQSGKDAITEMLLGMIPSFILMAATLTATFAAIDMTAGEKERGTLETLLTFPIKSSFIIFGKFIATTLCTMVSSLIGFISMYGVLYFMSGKLEAFKGIKLLNIQNFIFALIIFIVYSMLISADAISLASKAKSFKEAQNITQPLAFFSIFPMFLSMVGTKTSLSLSIVPFINVNLLLGDIISNNLNISYLLIAVASSIVFTVIILNIVSSLYKSDKILF